MALDSLGRHRTHARVHARRPTTPTHPHDDSGMDGDGHARERGHDSRRTCRHVCRAYVRVWAKDSMRACGWVWCVCGGGDGVTVTGARASKADGGLSRVPRPLSLSQREARAHSADLMRLLLARSLTRARTRMDTRTVLNNGIKEPHSHLAVFVIEREGLARLDFIQNYGVQVRGPALLQLHRFAGGCDPSAHLLPLQHPQVAASRLVQVPR